MEKITYKRGKGKIKAQIRTVHFFKSWKKHNKQYKKDVSFTTFSGVLSDYLSTIMDEVILHNYEYRLPLRLGYIKILKRKPKPFYLKNGMIDTKHYPIDYKRTKELWETDPVAREKKKLIFITNEHTDGYRYKFWWDKRGSNIKNKNAYSFEPVRIHQRKLAKVLTDEDINVDFFKFSKK